MRRAARRPWGRTSARAAAPLAAGMAVLTGLAALAGCSSSEQGPPVSAEKQLTIWLTGYSWQDNSPPESSKVGEPILHQVAGGVGTFADPITVAVPGHEGRMPWAPGTKFYLPTVRRYVIVEDSGAAIQPPGTDTHLDMWIGGQDGTKAATDDCEAQFTGKVPAQPNPPDGLPVMLGPVFTGGKCNIPAQPEDMGTYKHDTHAAGGRHPDSDDDHDSDDDGDGN